ncbi:5' nucleotidase, NT5C type [Longispora urticae]
MAEEQRFILGVDLDGVVADFYGYMRKVTAEWRGVPEAQLTTEVTYGLPEWGLLPGEYKHLHRFAVDQRRLFADEDPIPGAPQALRHLSTEGIRIRIITHRLFISRVHQAAVEQTVQWLDGHGVPYWDLCFMKEKGDVGAELYIEDSPDNVARLREAGKDVIIFTNSTNRQVPDGPGGRVDAWPDAERLIRERYYAWRNARSLPLPSAPGHKPA